MHLGVYVFVKISTIDPMLFVLTIKSNVILRVLRKLLKVQLM